MRVLPVDLRQHHVLERAAIGQQVERLEDEPDAAAANSRALAVGEAGGVETIDQVAAARRAVEAAQDVEERGFAGPRKAR
jgi:hypothetical protein